MVNRLTCGKHYFPAAIVSWWCWKDARASYRRSTIVQASPVFWSRSTMAGDARSVLPPALTTDSVAQTHETVAVVPVMVIRSFRTCTRWDLRSAKTLSSASALTPGYTRLTSSTLSLE